MDIKNFLLVGSESYNLRKRKEEIIRKTVGVDDGFSVTIYRGIDKVDVRTIIEDCQTAPFLMDGKVVIYENPTFFTEKEKTDDQDNLKNEEVKLLTQYLQDPNPETTFIIYFEGTASERSKIVKELCKYVKYERYDILNADEFRNLVNRDLNDAKLKLDRQAVEVLLQRLPLSVENWKQELEKLKLYPGTIDRYVVADLVSKQLEDNAFELSNAVVDRQLAKAIAVFRDLMVINKNDIPAFIGLLANQFRTMSQVRIMDDMGMEYLDIAAAIGSKSDYRVKMVLKSIGGATSKELLKLLNDLSDLDQSIKMGSVDPQIGLELFIMKACRR